MGKVHGLRNDILKNLNFPMIRSASIFNFKTTTFNTDFSATAMDFAYCSPNFFLYLAVLIVLCV